ncbi:MAG TPA: Hsp20/alpha crystallin family protein [Spirochaetia bacterium]|nr:Hsp20/alpha crystallin family protein [Spirochaetia bacterium]
MNGVITYRNNYSDLLEGIDRVFASLPGNSFKSRTPSVDIREEDDRYVLEAELSGLTEADVEVRVHENLLTVSSSTKESDDKATRYLLKERRSASFSRSFALPKDVDREKIDAAFKNGLLTLTLHKVAAMQPRSIVVKSN